MTFSVEPSRLLNVVEKEGNGGGRFRKNEVAVRLLACEGSIWVEAEGCQRALKATVWDGGQCLVLAGELIHSLRDFGSESCVTISADEQGLCIRGEFIPVLRYCSWALPPGNLNEIAATD